MDDDSRVVDKGWDLPEYAEQTSDDAVTLSVTTTTNAADWLVNTMDSVVVPMSTAEVVEALRIHKLTDRSLIWRHGMPEWTAIDRVPSLKLAARLPATLGPKPSRPSQPVPATAAPVQAPTPTPSAVATPAAPKPSKPPPSASQPPRANPTPVGLARRSTLPFGMVGPNPSRPSHAKPSSPPSAPAPRSEEPEVLAVYARPAATISFDLSPSEPARVPPPAPEQPAPARPAPTPPPQTLAPTTTDTRSAPRTTPPPRSYNPDLSVVAASQFRDVQRSSKRWLLISSVASAAAASVLTLWLSGAAPWSRRTESKAATRAAETAPAAPARPAPAPVAATPAPEPAQTPTPAPSAAPATPSSAPLAQAMAAALAAPKPVTPKSKPVSVAPTTPRSSEPARTAQREGKAESNPYDVKLDDESGAQPGAKPPTRGLLEMMQESERPAPEPAQPEASTATGTNAPGF